MQQKTGRPVQFELLPDARASLLAWLERRGGTVDDYVFPSRVDHNGHLILLSQKIGGFALGKNVIASAIHGQQEALG